MILSSEIAWGAAKFFHWGSKQVRGGGAYFKGPQADVPLASGATGCCLVIQAGCLPAQAAKVCTLGSCSDKAAGCSVVGAGGQLLLGCQPAESCGSALPGLKMPQSWLPSVLMGKGEPMLGAETGQQ